MIKVIKYTPNKKVLLEIESIEKTRDSLYQLVDHTDSLNEYLAPFISSINSKEFADRIDLSEQSTVLDIGFGRGETSLYLASKGHQVVAIEPSRLNCTILEKLAKKFHLNITIYQGIAECIDQVEEDNFDLCLFNSSLHHCDDPIKAMKLCEKKLKPKGKILATNEPILKFYQTKKRYLRSLENHPIKMGHYGGNEHIYSYREYVQMFKKAGFQSISTYLHGRIQDPRKTLYHDFERKIDGQYIHSNQKLAVKFIILLLMSKWCKNPFLYQLSKHLSLLPMTFEAEKL